MWSDNETNRDFLNFRIVAETVSEMVVLADGKPLSIGVCGGWGVGKSSMVKLIQQSLSKGASEKFVFVEFNAWLYQGFDDARAALMEIIARQLVAAVGQGEENRSKLEKATAFLKRVNWGRATGLIATTAIPLAFGLPPIGVLAQILNSVKDVTDGDISESDIEGVKQTGKAIGETGTSLLNPKKAPPSPPEQIHDLREHFADALKEMNVTLVVFVDDLDRCSPQTAIATLEAIRLFLFIERTAFVVAADDQMIRQAVRAHFSGMQMTDELVTNYFDKLIQVPVQVPPLGTQEVRAYLFLLFIENSKLTAPERDALRSKVSEQLAKAWQGNRVDLSFMTTILPKDDDLKTKLEIADRIAPIMTSAEKIGGNPRLIKRFLNTLSLRTSIARSQGVTVDEAVLAKLLLFERCAPPGLVEQLVRGIGESEDGHADFLTQYEKAAEDQTYDKLPLEWNDDFTREWLVISPPFTGIDLRPALHVSKDQHRVISRAHRLSPAAAEVLDALLVMKSRPDATFLPKIEALPPLEKGVILDQLLGRAKGTSSWKADSFHAIFATTGSSPDLQSRVSRFLGGIPAPQIQPGAVQFLKDKPWTHEVLKVLHADPTLPKPTKKAIEDAGIV